jgi:thiol-disulfide isomerase/thioredoxin
MRIGAGLTIIAVVLAGLSMPAAIQGEPLAAGQAFPALAEYGLEGTVPDTSGAKVVVVDFWASWCPPCRAAFPVLDAVQADFGAQGVRVIAVSVDQNRGAMDAFLKRNPVTFAVVRDAGMKLVQRVEVPTMPTTFVLDARGIVRFVHAGFEGDTTRDKLRAEIKTLLEEKP